MAECILIDDGEYRVCTEVGPFNRTVFEVRTKDAMGEEVYVPVSQAPASPTVKVPVALLNLLATYVVAAVAAQEVEAEEATDE